MPQCGNAIVEPGEQCDDGNSTNGDACENNCTVPTCGNGIVYPGEQCDDGNTSNGDGCDSQCKVAAVYVKASNTDAADNFGTTIALSADGSTLAIGAPEEASSATGINGQDNNNSSGSGAVYVFTRAGATWSQQAYIKASNTDVGDQFGQSVALSSDGSTLVVGAPQESSNATGVGGDQTNNDLVSSGAAYVFTRTGTTWSQNAYLKASNADMFDNFGSSVAISMDGRTMAVGAIGEQSSGAVYVFTRTPSSWIQEAYVKAPNAGNGDSFGFCVALSADGSTLAVGAAAEASSATGINGDQTDNSAGGAGAVYVFTRSGTPWILQAYVKASNTDVSDGFGSSVALSADGSILAVGAPLEDSLATGINNSQANGAVDSGAAYLFARSGSVWTQQAYVKASNTGAGDQFGSSVALLPDGSTLAVGAISESSSAIGVGGDQASNAASNAGAVYTFARTGTAWGQQAYVKASNTGAGDQFGSSVALSSDGTLAAGARFEASAATGVGGDQSNNASVGAGAVYVLQ